MPTTDPLALERFRAIVKDAVGSFRHDTTDPVTEHVIDRFPDAHFERHTNEAGVPMRRVVIASEWEVDPSAQRCTNCAPGYDCERGIYTRA